MRIIALYFSPTGGTQKYAREIAGRLDAQAGEIDLTNPLNRQKKFAFGPDDFLVIGAPVYAGRLPVIPEGLFSNISGNNTPAVFIVTYGNRDYDDALLELSDLCSAKGFYGVAAGAFVAPHTYSALAGAGRPDNADVSVIAKFVAGIKQKNNAKTALHIKGNRPYKKLSKVSFVPKGDGKCITCGICAKVCPVQAIASATPKQTDKQKCIACFACVKQCPVSARAIKNIIFNFFIKRMEKEWIKESKKPEVFL